jgi:hypothetical protein
MSNRTFRDELIDLMVKHDLASISNTPEYILANVMLNAFHGFNGAAVARDTSKVLTISELCECERWRDGVDVCMIHGTTKPDA